jgi:hypothetical protein
MDLAQRIGAVAVNFCRSLPNRKMAALGILTVIVGLLLHAQTKPNDIRPYEKTFPQSKAAIEKALMTIRGSTSGRLPVLDGFAEPSEHPLDRYQRGYYQSAVDVTPDPSGGSVVHIKTKVTAWYEDPVPARSGYKLLRSNGRLEADLLDQLAEQLAKNSAVGERRASSDSAPAAVVSTEPRAAVEPMISAPAPASPGTNRTFSNSVKGGLTPAESTATETSAPGPAGKHGKSLQAEANELEEVLKNTAHPKNLVAVKKSGTPVVANPSLNAKPQFLASLHDEFELLDFNADWVHVRISGLSRGWIWRNSVEMPEGIADTEVPVKPGLAPAADLYRVIREETAQFPGDWEPLRSKNVKILSVQQVDGSANTGGPKQRLEYTKFLLEKSYQEISQKSQDLQGVVVIFDSVDGGMIAVTMATLQQWKAGTLSDSALWHRCFFDPPEMFDSPTPSGSK